MSFQIASSDPVLADIKKGPLANVVEISSTTISNDATSDNDQLPKQLVDAMQAIFGKHQGYRTSECSNSPPQLMLMLMLLPQSMPKASL